ncbi:hypothetical protein EJB05_45019 [Eragrostis curvula]|uniref:Glycine-rich protein n=1 Tax=Eragrostis curvula TaxID=38414 RepID=A0A5J9TJ51_9POAL|nr:hypothetical protein EJB05_45019 [Eragrostis curvula]
MAIKYVLLLGVVMATVLICQDAAYARELTEANDSEGMNGEVVEASQHKKDNLSGVHGNVNGYLGYGGHLGYGGRYGSGYLPRYGSGYGPRYGGRYGGLGYGGPYGRPFYNGGYGHLGYGAGQGYGYRGYGGYRGGFYGGRN